MKKVLIITYYWPPSGGSGVQRWLKFAKYLPQFGWQPYVFTPENPSFEVKDQSLVNDIPKEVEVYKLPIWEPYGLINKFKGKGNQQSDLVKKKKKGLLANALLWIRGNLFIPDPRRFWVKPAAKVLEDLISSNGIDVIVTTGPPHSMHLIGLKLKKKLDIKWVADFRDPWTQWGLLESFHMSKLAWSRHQKLEQKVLQQADEIVTVSKFYAEGLKKLAGKDIDVITNGFDDEEFKSQEKTEPESFIIRHIGVVDEQRNPRPVLSAIKSLAQKGIDCPLEFVGNVNEALKEEVKADVELKKLVSFKPYVPHSEVLRLYRESAVLLSLPMNAANSKGNIPGKIFEYLAAQRPILSLGDLSGDTAQIINQTGAGVAVAENDITGIEKALLKLQNEYESGNKNADADISDFTRRNLTEKLVKVLERS
ncbi:glycosyltransferase [Fulvivirga sp. RKSG066]|uniref:glycosyltransferase family 4 protein n=1 Tax=Fulvivirga aurantia TaxID=2529383 RepID=UPI0012BD702B|nr:glycosyltransferase family 4 protein [Fulvivirga aurantia]MTI22753.1 glycosyltransferase [Fulvivirga aurantia]